MAWYAFDILNYRADTAHLSTLEHGAYRLLIDEYMMTRMPLLDNDRALARIVGVSLEEWAVIAPTIRAFFKPRSGRLHQKRCDITLDAEDRRAQNRSEHSKKAALARWNGNNHLNAAGTPQASPSNAQPMLIDAIRPDQIRSDKERKKDLQHSRGSRLPADWMPSEEDKNFARQQGLDPNVVAGSFRDYWVARAGSGGAKLDWPATWRNWCRRAVNDQPRSTRTNGHGPSPGLPELPVTRSPDRPPPRPQGREVQ